MNRPRTSLWTGLVTFVLALAPVIAQAMCPPCGHRPRRIKITNPQRVFVFHRAGVEDLILEATYKGQAKDFGMILPVPNVPDVRMVKHAFFDELTKMAGNFQRFTVTSAPEAMRKAQADGWRRHVQVVRRQVTSVFTTVTLKAKTTNALQKWLDLHQYKYATGNYAMTVFQKYIDRGWLFLAIKVRVDRQNQRFNGRFRPMGIRFKSRDIVVPTRVASIHPNGMPFEFYVISNRAVKFPRRWGIGRRVTLALNPDKIMAQPALMKELKHQAFFSYSGDLEKLAKKMKQDNHRRYKKLLRHKLTGLYLSVFTGHFSRRQLQGPDLVLKGENLFTKADIKGFIQDLQSAKSLKKVRRARAVLSVAGAGHIDLLLQQLTHQDSQVRITFANILGALGEPSAVPHLIKALENESDQLAKWAVQNALRDITGLTFSDGGMKAWKKWWQNWNPSK